MKIKIYFILMLLLIVASSGCVWMDMGTLPGRTNSSANDINNNGFMVGDSGNSSDFHATLWNLNTGEIKDLGLLPGGTISSARAINDNNYVVGYSKNNLNLDRALIWNISDNTAKELNLLSGGARSRALNINDNKEIVGQAETGDKRLHAVYWNPYGTIIDLGAPAGGDSIALDINNFGKVVGYDADPAGYIKPVIWDINNGTMDYLTVPSGYTGAVANSINNLGDVVGDIYNSSGESRGIYWNISTKKIIIMDGHGKETIKDNNDNGLSIGQLLQFSGHENATVRNFSDIWTIVDLGSLTGGNSSIGNSINDIEQGVGTTTLNNGSVRATFWSSRLKGDADDSKKITSSDALLFLRKAVGQNIKPYHMFGAIDDVTCDKKITSSDALLVLRKAVGQDVIFC